MSRAVVTGACGFIGSHLVELLLADGLSVVGIDAFTPYYDRSVKEANLGEIHHSDDFELVEADLLDVDLDELLAPDDEVYHLAGQPGVRGSWRTGFSDYLRNNIDATQRLLEAAVRRRVGRVVYASSSSVYGNALSYPTDERAIPQPFSPYGVTKLAAEHLCTAYAANFGLHVASVRYFTVYGPRQRPDMALHRMIDAALSGDRFPLYGDGTQRRDFTFVGDAVRATRLAATADIRPGSYFNVGGGTDVDVLRLIEIVSEVTGRELQIERLRAEAGDATRTGADTTRAREELGWVPVVDLPEGIGAQAQTIRRRRGR